jgi:hypothetical protein
MYRHIHTHTHIYIYMFVYFRGLVLTRNQHCTNVTTGSPTLSRRDSTSPRALRRPIHPGGGSM